MKWLFHITVPHEPFNDYVRQGVAGQKLGRILEETKPEAIYFTGQNGVRGAVAVYNISEDSKIPSIAEPWFLTFNAEIDVSVCMNGEDLAKAGLDELGKKWG